MFTATDTFPAQACSGLLLKGKREAETKNKPAFLWQNKHRKLAPVCGNSVSGFYYYRRQGSDSGFLTGTAWHRIEIKGIFLLNHTDLPDRGYSSGGL